MIKISPLLPVMTKPLIDMALAEDFGHGGDITSQATVAAARQTRVVLKARDTGVIAGMDIAADTFFTVDPALSVEKHVADGDTVTSGTVVMTVAGAARSILAAERVALNFLGRLSGIATMTRSMVDAIAGCKAQIAATRKTTPGLRRLEKYAVMAGGGMPHRYGLDDALLIKDNHIAMAGGVDKALRAARDYAGHTVKIEIEVDTLAQLDIVLATGGADIVMLDNMSLDDMRAAVTRIDGRMVVEASGGVTSGTIRAIAETGVDLVSVGALTHSVKNFDIGLDYLS